MPNTLIFLYFQIENKNKIKPFWTQQNLSRYVFSMNFVTKIYFSVKISN